MKAFFIISNLIDAIVWSIVEKVFKLWKASIKFSVCRVIESLSEKAFHKIALEITDEEIQQKILETFKSAQIERHAQYIEEMIEEISQLLHNSNHPNKPKQHTSTNAQILQTLSLYDQIFTRYPKMMHIPLTMFHYLLEIPSADSRAALLDEINRSILSEDELAYIIAIVKKHEMSKLSASMHADQKHATTFTRHEFIGKLCKALELGTDLHLMPMSESFTSADKEPKLLLKLFVVLIPPFGEKGSEEGEKSKLFNFLNELELVKNPKIWDTYRALIVEHLKMCEREVILAKERSKDPMSVVQQTFENIRHHISLLENLNKHSSNDETTTYKLDLYKSLAKLPLSV